MRTAVIVDEHPLWLDAVEQVLERVPVEVVGKAVDLDAATASIEEHRPELVVAEISTSADAAAGLAWLSETAQRNPDIKMIVLSTSHDPAVIQRSPHGRRSRL